MERVLKNLKKYKKANKKNNNKSKKEYDTDNDNDKTIDRNVNIKQQIYQPSIDDTVNITEETTINTKKAVNNFIMDYFENEDIIGTDFDDISYKFLDIIDKMDVTKLSFPIKEFDIVFSGGGLKGYYNFGASEIIKKMINNNQIKIRNYIGVSVGAYVVVFLLLGISIHTIRNVYEFARYNKKKYDLNKIMIKACDKLLPDNVHEICNGKVKIMVSELTIKGMVPVIIDYFESKEHLLKVLHATSFIPFITTSDTKGIEINGKTYYDGAFTNNLPINISKDIPKLVFITSKVEYSSSYMFKILDRCPELLILRGAIEMEKFIKLLNSNDKIKYNKKIPIEWIVHKKHLHKIARSNSNDIQKIFLNILILVSLIFNSTVNLLNPFNIILFIKSKLKNN
jgi:predicted patatin/cPLA2 family phospholipase